MGGKFPVWTSLVFCKFVNPPFTSSSKCRILTGWPVRLYSYACSFNSQGNYEGYKAL